MSQPPSLKGDLRKPSQTSHLHRKSHIGKVNNNHVPIVQKHAWEVRLRTQLFTAYVSTFNSFIIGSLVGFPNVAVPTLRKQYGLSQLQQDFIISIFSFVNIFGAAISGWVILYCGLKKPLLLGILPTLLCWILVFCGRFVDSPTNLIATARAIQGLICGILIPIQQQYNSECAHNRLRGICLAMGMSQMTFGALVVYIIGYFLPWDYTCLVIMGIQLLPYPFFWLVPESPYWLVQNGRISDARDALTWLRGPSYPHTEEDLQDIITHHQKATQTAFAFSDLLERRHWFPLLLFAWLMFNRQFTGLFSIMYFSKDIFKDANVIVEPGISTIITVFVFDILGRKMSVIISALVMGYSQLMFGTYYYVQQEESISEHTKSAIRILPLIFLALSTVAFQSGLASGIFILQNELIPLKIKKFAVGFTMAENSLTHFLVVLTFPHMLQWIGTPAVFWLYGSFAFTTAFSVMYFTPETMGMSFKEIEHRASVLEAIQNEEILKALPLVKDESRSFHVDYPYQQIGLSDVTLKDLLWDGLHNKPKSKDNKDSIGLDNISVMTMLTALSQTKFLQTPRKLEPKEASSFTLSIHLDKHV
ncbi:unnamed protein product [Cyprideis torosa]|uniref:Uncharacterized protein n=1 Tax=Cyprideis torosa TaxID=163714 RepID=A0A7R8WAG9_9CRUS|nr:unnamed protein product [Cyprideis torosa]CAG0886339.1 unnamed protein product [Cyprideis torosa]